MKILGKCKIIFKVGDSIKKDSECQTCTCQGEGNMNCQDFDCPPLSCAANEVEAHKDDACCGYCAEDWVKVSIIIRRCYVSMMCFGQKIFTIAILSKAEIVKVPKFLDMMFRNKFDLPFTQAAVCQQTSEKNKIQIYRTISNMENI